VDSVGQNPELAWVDTATAQSVPLLLKTLKDEGYYPEQVRWIIVTHAHLDHAGGAGVLASYCKNAQVLAHPRAARHLIDPSRLEMSARKVYGDESFEALYGKRLEGIPPARVVPMEEGSEVELGRSRLQFFHTRGHANHHFCVLDSSLSTVYTGDAFGLRYPSLQGQGLFVLPSTSPTDFDGVEALKTIDRILALSVKSYYPTHFGQVGEVQEAAEQLRVHLEFSIRLLEEATHSFSTPELESRIHQGLVRYYRDHLEARGQFFDSHQWRQLDLDLQLNAAGLAHCARKTRSADNP